MITRRRLILSAALCPFIKPTNAAGLIGRKNGGSGFAPPTSSIGSAPIRTYPTIQEWINALPRVIPFGSPYVGQCYNDSEFAVSVQIEFAGIDTTAWNGSGLAAITLTTGSGQSFRDNAGVRTNALAYNQANGVGVNFNITPIGPVVGGLVVRIPNVTISNMQFKLTNGNWTLYTDNNALPGAGQIVVDSCILDDFAGGGEALASGTISLVKNCLILAHGAQDNICPSGGVVDGPAGTGGHFKYCTVVSPSDNLNGLPNGNHPHNGWSNTSGEGGGTTTWENCAFFGWQQVSDVVGAGAAYTTCMTDSPSNTTEPYCAPGPRTIGPGIVTGQTYANQFQNTLSASSDYRAKSGANLLGAATPDVSVTTDISGFPRSGTTPDIGCWELT